MEVIEKIIGILKENGTGVGAVVVLWLTDYKIQSESYYQLSGMVWTMYGLGCISENEREQALDYLIYEIEREER